MIVTRQIREVMCPDVCLNNQMTIVDVSIKVTPKKAECQDLSRVGMERETSTRRDLIGSLSVLALPRTKPTRPLD